MSKAFVKDDADLPDVEAEDLQRRLGSGPRYVTTAGYEALVSLRAELRQDQTRAPRRLRLLELLVPRLVAVPFDRSRAGEAQLGSTVEVQLESGERSGLRLVGPDEVHQPADVAFDAPLGRALMGKTAGDDVEVRAPSGLRRYTVVSVEP